jgi:hypothetical protein
MKSSSAVFASHTRIDRQEKANECVFVTFRYERLEKQGRNIHYEESHITYCPCDDVG